MSKMVKASCSTEQKMVMPLVLGLQSCDCRPDRLILTFIVTCHKVIHLSKHLNSGIHLGSISSVSCPSHLLVQSVTSELIL